MRPVGVSEREGERIKTHETIKSILHPVYIGNIACWQVRYIKNQNF